MPNQIDTKSRHNRPQGSPDWQSQEVGPQRSPLHPPSPKYCRRTQNTPRGRLEGEPRASPWFIPSSSTYPHPNPDRQAKAKEDRDIMQKQIDSLTATAAKLMDKKNTNADASTVTSTATQAHLSLRSIVFLPHNVASAITTCSHPHLTRMRPTRRLRQSATRPR